MSGHNHLFEAYDADNKIKDPGDAGTIYIHTKDHAYVPLVSAGAETRTLANPVKAGKTVVLGMTTDGGAITLTCSTAYDTAGSTTVTFADAGGYVVFKSVETSTTAFAWRVVAHDGVSGIPTTVNTGHLVSVGDANYTVLAANTGKPHLVANVSADRTITLPSPASGLDFEFIANAVVADGHDWIFDTGSDTNYFTGGVQHLDTDAGPAADEVVPVRPDGNSNSKLQINLPDVGTKVRFISDGTLWNVSGSVFSATAPAFADQ